MNQTACERLRALENDIEATDRLVAKSRKLNPDIMYGRVFIKHRDTILSLIAELGQEVGAVPSFRGYANLGVGAYLLEHSAEGEDAELCIVPATEAEKAGRTVGDLRHFEGEREPISAERMAVRIRFDNVAGLDALEQQLRLLRDAHFPTSPAHTSEARDCPAQFFASGPQGDFFTADSKFANHLILVAGYDRDDWTVTDLYAAMRQEGGTP